MMIGNRYWSTGIVLKYDGRGSWSATAEFFDSGFCDDESTEGRLHTRYYVPLETAIDVVIADAAKLGIEFNKNTDGKSILMVRGDGEYEDCPLPENWKEVLEQQAVRIGWASAYGTVDHG